MILTNPDLDNLIKFNNTQKLNINHLDSYLASLLLENEEKQKDYLFFIIAYLSMKTRNGDVCIDINNDSVLCRYFKLKNIDKTSFISELNSLACVGLKESDAPIIIDGDLCYLNRFYRYEEFLASWLLKKSEIIEFSDDEIKKLKSKIIPKYFIGDKSEIDWQKFSTILACFLGLCVISGGPGTGKTTTIVKILGVLQELYAPKYLNIVLCAPTGKAASRLIEAVNDAKKRLNLPKNISDEIPDTAYTIHRLLEYQPHKKRFKYDGENRLSCDLLVVDEASMVDLKLMTSLCSALEDSSRLILLGDRFQLASVSPGSVLGDICKQGKVINYSKIMYERLSNFFDIKLINKEDAKIETKKGNSFGDSIVELKKSYRFDAKSGIGQIAKSIKKGDFLKTYEILNSKIKDVNFINFETLPEFEKLINFYTKEYYFKLIGSDNPENSFELFSDFMILSPLREGPFGVSKINDLVESKILKKFNIDSNFWYHGKPVIINRNDYKNSLFNGDTGLCLKDGVNGLKIFFNSLDNTFKKIHLVRLNYFEPVYSMTVHKSQGSEFNNILIILPDNSSPLLKRELIYTAVTRAKKSVVVAGSKSSLKNCIENKVTRVSGLYTKLWG